MMDVILVVRGYSRNAFSDLLPGRVALVNGASLRPSVYPINRVGFSSAEATVTNRERKPKPMPRARAEKRACWLPVDREHFGFLSMECQGRRERVGQHITTTPILLDISSASD